MAQQNRRGGTEGGEVSRAMDVALKESGTPGIASPAGDVHVEPPSRYQPRTDLESRPTEGTARLMGGKTAQDVLGYVAGVSFPAKKDALVRAARRNGAPDDVLGAMNMLSHTEYESADALPADYPRLPDENEVEPGKGQT